MTDTPAPTHHPDRKRYNIVVGGVEAYLTYERPREKHIHITHTIVPKSLGGRGLGKQLVASAMQDAVAHDETVSSACWYATALIEKTPDWAARFS